MAASEEEVGVYFVVNNIPVKFRSADLRNYFSQFIESGGFLCFHYRHRPEVRINTAEAAQRQTQKRTEEEKEKEKEEEEEEKEKEKKEEEKEEEKEKEEEEEEEEEKEKEKEKSGSEAEASCCCVVSVRGREAQCFVKMYSGNPWIDSKGNWLVKRCLIRRIKVSDHTDPDVFPYKTKAALRHPTAHTELFTKADLHALPELTPPALMPAGNVGTPVSVFLQFIQSCRFPPRLIRKLGLTFPKTGSHRRYGNVPYHYNTAVMAASEESVFTAGGVEICGPGCVAPPKSTEKPRDGTHENEHRPIRVDRPAARAESEEEEEESGPDDDDDRCEEWERHEALHEDVTSQERTKERLYEEEIELKWEKGGSGLVFYTDAQYWQEEEGDFDEQTADDWDVDMSVYYDKDGGDMDSRDYVRMRYEKRLRDGVEQPEISGQKIGTFEKFTKGVGRRVMERQGWKDGEGLGHARSGIPEALENEGQHPNCKRGFGYHGEKLSSFQPLKKPRPDFHISTVYDEPKDIDRGDTLLRQQPSTSMKYTHWHPGKAPSHKADLLFHS